MYLCLKYPQNKHYQFALKREIEIESRGKIQSWPPSIELHPLVISYINQEIIGKNSTVETDWYDIFIHKHKPVDVGLSLGSGIARQQKVLVDKGFVKKWESIDLIVHKKEAMCLKSEEMSLLNGDLNFIELPEDRYPLIFCHGVLHHIINLEHLLFQINRALTKNGIFIVCEYVGEKKQQWQDVKSVLIKEKLIEKFSFIYPFLNLDFNKRPILNRRPLESIRSDEIPVLLKKTFGDSSEYEYLGIPLLYPIINHFSRYNKKLLLEKPEVLEDILTFAIQIDREYKNTPGILPTQLIGIYHKSSIKNLLSISPWSKKDIRTELSSHDSLYNNLKRYWHNLNIKKHNTK